MTSTRDATVRRAAVGGFELAFGDVGRGTPLLLLHGYPFDHTLWRHQLRALADTCRVIAPDLRGHGDSDAPGPPYRMVDFAEDTRALLDQLAIDRVVLGGLSMGGYIALAFAERYPERLRGLALLSTRADTDTEEVRQGRHTMALRARQGGAERVVDELAGRILGDRPVPEEVDRQLREMILGTSVEGLALSQEGMASRRDHTALLGTVRVPSLVVVGTDDTITPPASAREMAAALPDAELLEIPASGHLLPIEQPEPTTAALRRLVARADA